MRALALAVGRYAREVPTVLVGAARSGPGQARRLGRRTLLSESFFEYSIEPYRNR
jgi:hypothetical protein